MRDRIDASALYRAVWAWHFYAGLIVLPFLVLLATTGAVYLFKPEIDHAVYRDLIEVPARAQAAVPLAASVTAVERALDGRVEQVMLADRPDRSLRMLVRVASGEARTAYADPYDGRFLGSTPAGGVMQLIRKVHSLQYFGFWASSLIEIAAGWTIVLVAMGFFLWWPRGRRAGVVSIGGSPGTRRFWRDLHAVIGAFTAVVVLFLAVTGMPWSKFWGVQGWVDGIVGEQLATLTRQTPVVLYVDKSVRFERFVKVIDLLKANRLEKLSIVARGDR